METKVKWWAQGHMSASDGGWGQDQVPQLFTVLVLPALPTAGSQPDSRAVPLTASHTGLFFQERWSVNHRPRMHSVNWWDGHSCAQVSCSAPHPGWPGNNREERSRRWASPCTQLPPCAEKPSRLSCPWELAAGLETRTQMRQGSFIQNPQSTTAHGNMVLSKHWRPGGHLSLSAGVWRKL